MIVLTRENAARVIKSYGGVEISPVSSPDRGLVLGIYGPGGCLDESTHIPYVITVDGYRSNHKGGTIQHLYERFHKIPVAGKGYYQRPSTAQGLFWIASSNEQGELAYNRVVNVYDTGRKPCYEITTTSGRTIVATEEHRFFTGERFVPLADLREGNCVAIHNNTMQKRKVDRRPPKRSELFVKHHPYARSKLVVNWNAYFYAVLRRSRAVLEARLNELSLDDYVRRLNGTIEDTYGLQFLPPNVEVHHKDEDTLNDDPDNLVVYSKADHARQHHPPGTAVARYVVAPDTVSAIRYVGSRHTYDIGMESPHNNYVANKFVVHNSGKTTLAATITDAADDLGSPALLLNARGNPHVIASYAGKIDIADITRFDQVEKIRADMLRDKAMPYKSIIIDNVTELWSMDLRDRYGPMTTVEWTKHSASTSDIMQLVRNWIDLAEIGPKLNVIFVFQETPETRDIRGRTGVIVSEVAFNKALQSHIPSLINFLGRLYIHTDQPPYRRVLDFRPIDTIHQAKLQVDRDDQYASQIPFEIFNPSLASVLDTIRGKKPWPVEKHSDPSKRGR
jgi:hypothetical protein